MGNCSVRISASLPFIFIMICLSLSGKGVCTNTLGISRVMMSLPCFASMQHVVNRPSVVTVELVFFCDVLCLHASVGTCSSFDTADTFLSDKYKAIHGFVFLFISNLGW